MEDNSINANGFNSNLCNRSGGSGGNQIHLRHEKNGVTPATISNGTLDIRRRDRYVQANETFSADGIAGKSRNLNVTLSQLIFDKANMCTFFGTIMATLAIANVWKQRYFLGLALSTLASLADILDGPIARSSRGRRQQVCSVGKYLDTYSDVVSHFVVPASLLMNLSDLNALCVILSALFVCTGVLRHARHEIIERLDGGSCCYGVTSDYLVFTSVMAMYLAPVVEVQTLIVILFLVMSFQIFASLSQLFKTRRYGGVDLFIVGLFHVWIFFSCVFMRHLLVSQSGGSFWKLDENFGTVANENQLFGFSVGQLSFGFFCFNLALAYPCYYRFVEINL